MNVIDEANASELPRVLHKSSRRLSWIVGLLAISFALCAVAAYLWANMETILARSPEREPAVIAGLSPEDRQALLEIRSGQQRADDEIAELNRNIGAQQADLKRMADRIEALTAKIESLQSSPVAVSAAASVPPAPSPPAAQVSKPAKRLVHPPKPEGPISVGGAPLIREPGSASIDRPVESGIGL